MYGCLRIDLCEPPRSPSGRGETGSGALLRQLGEDVALAEDLDFPAAHLDVVAAVLAVDDLVADLDVQHRPLAAVAELAGADRQHSAALRLLLGRVGQQDAAGR